MNGLAHLALTPAHEPALRLGNVCADFFTLAELLPDLALDFTEYWPRLKQHCAP